ncbi:diphthine methyl ester synthase-like isoform X1 [Hydractinia symbiolongicarpus]|uniref:diphthine methyl ester synthase-like isoform X1 n=1 Tax=Hydractinia symbiolongicarpus TaxID=13093 RepID=UPI00254C5AFC|nr:diphthine methyl ester synthase-like isoform X1 [Hydractinia symbiolongicarpus]
MLYLVGLGLGDSKDITVKGLEIVKKAHKVFLEAYTSILKGGKEELETFYGREVVLADRTLVEEEADEILSQAKENDVVFLVVGDPFGATTHTDLIIRARKKEIQYKVVHNASIMNAVGCCGLQLYNFGETVSIVMWSENWKPDSFYGKIIENKKRGLHTLCLLDIKVKEQTIENMIRGRKIYEPPCYLTAQDAMQQLLYVSDRRHAENKECTISEDCYAVILARVGWDDQKIVTGKISTLLNADVGPPIHSLVIPGEMHFLENDMLKLFAVNKEDF